MAAHLASPGAPQSERKANANSGTELCLEEQWANFSSFNCIFPRFLQVFMLFCQNNFQRAFPFLVKDRSFSLVAFPSVHTQVILEAPRGRHSGKASPRPGRDSGGTAWLLSQRSGLCRVDAQGQTLTRGPSAIRTQARRLSHFALPYSVRTTVRTRDPPHQTLRPDPRPEASSCHSG